MRSPRELGQAPDRGAHYILGSDVSVTSDPCDTDLTMGTEGARAKVVSPGATMGKLRLRMGRAWGFLLSFLPQPLQASGPVGERGRMEPVVPQASAWLSESPCPPAPPLSLPGDYRAARPGCGPDTPSKALSGEWVSDLIVSRGRH